MKNTTRYLVDPTMEVVSGEADGELSLRLPLSGTALSALTVKISMFAPPPPSSQVVRSW